MRFKPTFEGACRANQNKNIAFCAVKTDDNREASIAYQVSSIPQFNFILDGQESTKFIGADPTKFSQALAVLQQALSGKAFEHMGMKFSQFKPQNKLPISFESQGQISKMKDFVVKFAKQSEKDVDSTAALLAWLEGSMDLNGIPKPAIDELRQLAEIAEDKPKIALIDLIRLLILNETQCEYIVTSHWELIEVCIFGYISAQNLQDADAKVMQNYH